MDLGNSFREEKRENMPVEESGATGGEIIDFL